jgi:ribonuclease PH
MRTDGRKADEMRIVKITPEYMAYAEGSCLVEMGNTKVICTASIEDGVPSFLKGKGTGWLTAEYSMLPRSCQKRTPRESTLGKKGGRTHEIQRLIGRAMRSVCDLSEIGERTVWLDADVMQADGGTRCASITGCFIALYRALQTIKMKNAVKSFPVSAFVAAVSVGIVDGKPLLDLTYEEDSSADVDMNVVMTDAEKYVEVQGTAEKEPFDSKSMESLLGLASKGVRQIIQFEKNILKGGIQ